ncbi:MAG: hypothetical protein ABI643_01480 [Candidatus Doudnabacteria bacterium]
MALKPFGDMLRELGEKREESAPNRHRNRTEQCLTFSKLVLNPRIAPILTAEECEHIASCADYCQRMIALDWRARCPENNILQGYAIAGENFSLKHAVGFHLGQDRCAVCQAKIDAFRAGQ